MGQRRHRTWHFPTASFIFSTLTSLKPRILSSVFRVAACTLYTHKPTAAAVNEYTLCDGAPQKSHIHRYGARDAGLTAMV